jgi:hypothetical protein
MAPNSTAASKLTLGALVQGYDVVEVYIRDKKSFATTIIWT